MIWIKIGMEDDGTLKFLDANGQPLPPEVISKAKQQHADAIRKFIEEACDKVNAQVEALGRLQIHTPAPHERLRYEPQEFDTEKPEKPIPKRHGILDKWQVERAASDESEQARKVLLEERVLSDVEAMEKVLEDSLKSIEWPRETTVSAEVNDGGPPWASVQRLNRSEYGE